MRTDVTEDMAMGKMTEEEKKEYERMTRESEQLRLKMDELMNKPTVYGYLRVSSKGQARDGNSLEAQKRDLEAAGAEVLYTDIYTGTTTDRPELDKLIGELKNGDTIIVTKLDRIARSVQQGIELIDNLTSRGIAVRVLNMGTMDDTPTGRLIRNVMLSFAEFERDMIMQRTREGREVARQNPDHREGRKPIYTDSQIKHALDLLSGPYSYSDVVKMTGISKSTLIRAKRACKAK